MLSIGAVDQAEKAASDTAKMVAAFYKGLREAGMSEDYAASLTEIYARKLLKVPGA